METSATSGRSLPSGPRSLWPARIAVSFSNGACGSPIATVRMRVNCILRPRRDRDMNRRTLALLFAVAPLSVSVAQAGTSLPEKRPGDIQIRWSHGGGMRGDHAALELSAKGGVYEEGLRATVRKVP